MIVGLRLALDTVLLGLLMFGAAGTIAWSRGWVLLIVLLVVRGATAVALSRANPRLLRARARAPIHARQTWIDRVLVLSVLVLGMLGIPTVAAADAFRWHIVAPPPIPVSAIGLALFIAGWTLKGRALAANAHAVAEVRVQEKQVVASGGVYRVVRHPFYAADPLIFVGAALWLQSWIAAALSVAPVTLMIARLLTEEALLKRELSGYAAYAERVRYRLIPGVW